MSSELPKPNTKLAEVEKALAQTDLKKTLALEILNAPTHNGKLGAAALLQLEATGVLNEFANWATHPLSGIMYRDISVHPLPDKVAESLSHLITEINTLNAPQKDSDSKPQVPDPEVLDRRAAIKRIAKNAVFYGAAFGTGWGAGEMDEEKDPDKKLEAGATGAVIGGALGLVLGAGAGIVKEEINAPSRERQKRLRAPIDVIIPHKAPLEMENVLIYACQALEKLHSQSQKAARHA